MSVIRGPFTIKWGDNVLNDVEELDLEYEVDSEDYETIQGRTLTIDGSHRVSATLTLLSTDIATLSLILPQYHVANGGVMSTGETVSNANGAMDIRAAACDEELIFDDLDIISCGNPTQTLRIVNTRTRIDDVDIDNKIQKIMVRFIGETIGDNGVIQIFRTGSMAVVS